MKIVFMGTPDFAVSALEALIAAGHEITAVVTQPDKARGRSGKLQAPPVKECALRHDIPVMQPRRIKTPEAVEELKKYEAKVYIVAAFGQILSKEILEIPEYGCLNIHASLLPRYRGASPIQHAIIDGESKTGVTIMQMDEGVDTGDMLYKKSIPIEEDDTWETLHDKLKIIGGEAVCEALRLLGAGELVPEKQDDSLSIHAPLIEKSMGHLDFTMDAVNLDRLIRGLNPWPGAYALYGGKQLKIWKAVPVTDEAETAGLLSEGSGADAGRVIRVEKDAIIVACKDGALRIEELQLEGRKRMSAHDFLLGVRVNTGETLE